MKKTKRRFPRKFKKMIIKEFGRSAYKLLLGYELYYKNGMLWSQPNESGRSYRFPLILEVQMSTEFRPTKTLVDRYSKKSVDPKFYEEISHLT